MQEVKWGQEFELRIGDHAYHVTLMAGVTLDEKMYEQFADLLELPVLEPDDMIVIGRVREP